MNEIYKDIRSQHPIGPEKLLLSRRFLKIEEIAPDFMSFWDPAKIDSKYSMKRKTVSLSDPVEGKIVKLNFSVTRKKIFIHSKWFWDEITFSELDILAKANKLSFVAFPSYFNYREKLVYFKQLEGCIPSDYGFYTQNPITFDPLPTGYK